ncbi:hypothetical protein PTTG_29021 [Puccinia triticina 1-1 BBBD Race 1]|uniref:Uncharacterized protein n=2 Tax=Puccinia triticina TaxID=208348 RepID=A0A180G760_PUCT1|nr:uncharacterized protein PtA15_12A4 [Puccinia triticina]OAV88454.1 hypothetical protein PTTG_29021 [Puccinia triticina 1-1 BBBD Race 1]WAQ90019.1 hypothetical protein PtA15_12A4 [Puccinia triticina]WAR61320.1 hypothetical protein PtB15_12B5 [Puccinia triticina]
MSDLHAISTTLGEQLMSEEPSFWCHNKTFWKTYDAYVYAYNYHVNKQREASKEINFVEAVRIAMYDVFCERCTQRKAMRDAIRADKNFLSGRHQKPDILSFPRTPARDALYENWHRFAQTVAWTCSDITRNHISDYQNRPAV